MAVNIDSLFAIIYHHEKYGVAAAVMRPRPYMYDEHVRCSLGNILYVTHARRYVRQCKQSSHMCGVHECSWTCITLWMMSFVSLNIN